MDISLIICTWNNYRRLEVTLQSIERCRIPPGLAWEAVVVNNNCQDLTDEVVEKFSNRIPLQYVKEPRQGLSNARNAGMKNATGDLIIFADDDITPCEEWIEVYWNAFKENRDGFFWGGLVFSEFENPRVDPELVASSLPCVKGLTYGDENRLLTERGYFLDCNWACPKKALTQTGGFDPALGLDPTLGIQRTGEETDLFERLKKQGLKPYYLAAAKVDHYVPKEKSTLRHVARRREAVGRAEASYYKDWLKGRLIVGIPAWLCKRVVKLGLKACLAKVMKRRDFVTTYLELRHHVGFIKGFYHMSRSERGLSSGAQRE